MNTMYNDKLEELREALYHMHVVNLYKQGIVPNKNSLRIFKKYISSYGEHQINTAIKKIIDTPTLSRQNKKYFEYEKNAEGELALSLNALRDLEDKKLRLYGRMIDFKTSDYKAFKHLRERHLIQGSYSWVDKIMPNGDLVIRISKAEGSHPFRGNLKAGQLCQFNFVMQDSYETASWVLRKSDRQVANKFFIPDDNGVVLNYDGEEFKFSISI